MKLEIDVSRRALYALVTVCAVGAAAVYGLRARAEPLPTIPANMSPGNTLTAATMNQQFQAMRDVVNQLNDPKCPMGYTQDTTITGIVDCKSGNDEVVKVGTKRSAFWIDRYEASVWSDPAAAATQYGAAADDYPSSFPDNGQLTAPLYAVSKSGVKPSASLTWFQAVEACAASGKRLPNGQEWLRAARGTPDGAGCNLSTSGPRNSGGGATCVSVWGAQDMIGNVGEWTDEWYAATALPGTMDGDNAGVSKFGAAYNGDGVWGVTGVASNGLSNTTIPATAWRGGTWLDGTRGGVFAVNLQSSPANWNTVIGFRCLLPR